MLGKEFSHNWHQKYSEFPFKYLIYMIFFRKGKMLGTEIRSVVARDWGCGQVIDCKGAGKTLLEQWKCFISGFWCCHYTTLYNG